MNLHFSRQVSGRAFGQGLLAAAASVALLVMGTASAATDGAVGTISGEGTISPGLSASPANQQWTFDASGSVQDPSNQAGSGSYSCSFSGNSGPVQETLALGTGTFSGSCSGPMSIAITGGTYTRQGVMVTIEGTASVSNGSVNHFVAHCLFIPPRSPLVPMTSYSVFCGISFENVF
jgi:hypothetical protein